MDCMTTWCRVLMLLTFEAEVWSAVGPQATLTAMK